jgi:hypothetical protein
MMPCRENIFGMRACIDSLRVERNKVVFFRMGACRDGVFVG